MEILGQTIRICGCFNKQNMMVSHSSWADVVWVMEMRCLVRCVGGKAGVRKGGPKKKATQRLGNPRGKQTSKPCHMRSPPPTCAAMSPTHSYACLFLLLCPSPCLLQQEPSKATHTNTLSPLDTPYLPHPTHTSTHLTERWRGPWRARGILLPKSYHA